MKKTIATLVVAGLAAGASAQSVSGYDISDAAQSGFGNWAHTYDGTITGTGSDSGQGFPFDRADYTGGGSGTLNDGATNVGSSAAQLFARTSSTNPSITLYLDGAYFIDDITIWGFDSGNSIPGNIDGYDVTINGNTASVGGTESLNDLMTSLAGTGLENLGTTSVTLSNFVLEGQSGWTELFSMSEITLSGRAVPAPSALALLGLGGLAAARRRR